MTKRPMLVLYAALLLTVPFHAVGVHADEHGDEAAAKRAELDRIAADTLDELFAVSPAAKKLYDKSHGYAVFSSLKVALGLSGGGGSGVAVDKGGERTYMRMGTAGVGLGAGGKRYRIVFLFETEKKFRNFVDKGWQAEASASAVAATDGVDAASSFHDGVAIFQFSKRGLMAQAEVAGTKYWRSEKLN